MVNIIFFLFVMLFWYGVAVCVVQTVKHCTTREAASFCIQKIKEVFAWSWKEAFAKPPVQYMTHIGWDGERQCFNPKVADEELVELGKLFQFFRCIDIRYNENVYAYRISIVYADAGQKNSEEFKTLVTKVLGGCLADHMMKYSMWCGENSSLFMVTLYPEYMEIAIARNDAGKSWLEALRKKREQAKIEDQRKAQGICTLEEVWGENKGDRMTWGYDAKIAHQYQTKSSIQTEIDTHCHALITGSSGSGKSVAVSYLLGRRLQADPKTHIFICDYKNSEDFRFLNGYENYYKGERCYDGIMAFYQRFHETRESGGAEKERYLLIFDEYPAFLNRLQMLDKQNKEKRAADVMNAVSEILMLGRGLHYGIWIVTQRADAALFANGSRDNFMCILALGRLSKEQKNMLFSGEELPERSYQQGEGVILLDGREVEEVKIPWVTDVPGWRKHMLDTLEQSADGNVRREG